MREVLGIVPTTVPMVFPVLLSGSIAFGAPCRARLALVGFRFESHLVTMASVCSDVFADLVGSETYLFTSLRVLE